MRKVIFGFYVMNCVVAGRALTLPNQLNDMKSKLHFDDGQPTKVVSSIGDADRGGSMHRSKLLEEQIALRER